MDKDVRKKVAVDTAPKDRETVIKLLSDGADVVIPIDEKDTPVYWEKTGHTDRTYHRAYIKSKIIDAYKSGIMQRYKEVEVFEIKEPKRFIIPKRVSVVPESISLTSDDDIVSADTYQYHSDVAVIDFVDKLITGKFKLEYEYYDEETYTDFVDIFSTCLLIYLSVRKRKDHNVRVFDTVKDVEILKLEERNDIITKYYKDIGVTEQDLKNLQAPFSTVPEETSQKNTV